MKLRPIARAEDFNKVCHKLILGFCGKVTRNI